MVDAIEGYTAKTAFDTAKLRHAANADRLQAFSWATFIRNHASAIVCATLFTSVTATFQVLYVFVAIEIGSRRILHGNVTDHPNGRLGPTEVDAALKGFGLRVWKKPVRNPMANARASR